MTEKEEEKGFVIKDKRRFTSEEESGKETRAESETAGKEEMPGQEPPESGSEKDAGEAGRERPFPEVTMATFIFSLSSSALVLLGEIPEPETNQTRVDLGLAKQIIDTLGMLEEKTKGNLDKDEERLLKSVLYDLRMRYVQKSSGK